MSDFSELFSELSEREQLRFIMILIFFQKDFSQVDPMIEELRQKNLISEDIYKSYKDMIEEHKNKEEIKT